MLHSLDNTLGPCFKEHHWHIQKKSLLHCIVFLKVLRLLLYLYCFASSHKIRQKKPVCWLPHGKTLWPLPVWGPSSVHPHHYSIPILTPPQPRTPASLSPQHSSLAPAPPGCFQGNSAMSQQNEGKKKTTHHCLEILPSRCRAALAPGEGNPLLHQPGGARTLLRAQPGAGTRSRRRQPGQRNPAARPATARARVRADAGQDTRQADASSTPHPPPQAHSAVKAFPKTLFRLSFSRTKVREARAAPQ